MIIYMRIIYIVKLRICILVHELGEQALVVETNFEIPSVHISCFKHQLINKLMMIIGQIFINEFLDGIHNQKQLSWDGCC